MIRRAPLFLIFLVAIACTPAGNQQLDLSGEWRFLMDPEDKGVSEKWFKNVLPEVVTLPGSMVENGKGDKITFDTKWTGGIKEKWYEDSLYKPYEDSDHVRIPFWLQPDKKYLGAAWYQKELIVPRSWRSKQVILYLERCHWKTEVWINSSRVGSQNSLSVPHRYDITEFLKRGINIITICVDNRTDEMDPGENSHSITDHTQTNWNGMTGDLHIQVYDKIRLGRIKLTPDIGAKSVAVEAEVINNTERSSKIDFSIWAGGKNFQMLPELILDREVSLDSGNNILKFSCYLGEDARLWDEFNPNTYEISLKIQGDRGQDSLSTLFGLREFKADSTRFTINGHPVFLRGTLECAIFPKTGYPSTDVKDWSRIFGICKAHGLNHMRFHSWCPPDAAFEAADLAGIYLHVECASWANQSTTLGDGKPIDQYIYDESERIVDQYGNHPSFCMMAYGNEPGGNYLPYLKKFVSYWKEKDSRRVYTSAAGWPLIPENDYYSSSEKVRIQGWGEELNSIINSQPPRTDYDWSEGIEGLDKPMVSHEIGQWCVYPDFKEIVKYTGPLKARNFEIFQEKLNDHGLGEFADTFLMASGKLQALCYKADIEAALRTPGFGGFQLLDLHDFPGQGTALVGVLNPFWEEKGYITATAFNRFCGETVPLARMEKRIYSNAESFHATIEVAHFGAYEIARVIPKWRITDRNGVVITKGFLEKSDIPVGNHIQLGEISFPLRELKEAVQLNLEVTVGKASNDWDFWVYPEHIEEIQNENILISQKPDHQTMEYLLEGGSVLLTPKKGSIKDEFGGSVGVGFSSIFWNTSWTGGQKPHTLGILCDPKHPALEYFPTEYYSDWQWWDAMSHCNAIFVDSLSVELKPIVRIIDDWVTCRSLAMIFEVRVGKGKLMVSSVDLLDNQEDRIESKQLMYSLLSYMNGPDFDPEIQVPLEEILKLFK
jgi:hypothetical protein